MNVLRFLIDSSFRARSEKRTREPPDVVLERPECSEMPQLRIVARILVPTRTPAKPRVNSHLCRQDASNLFENGNSSSVRRDGACHS